jgi:hypothetical protein
MSTFPLTTNLALNDWSYLSFIISRIDAITNRTSISVYVGSRISTTITTGAPQPTLATTFSRFPDLLRLPFEQS